MLTAYDCVTKISRSFYDHLESRGIKDKDHRDEFYDQRVAEMSRYTRIRAGTISTDIERRRSRKDKFDRESPDHIDRRPFHVTQWYSWHINQGDKNWRVRVAYRPYDHRYRRHLDGLTYARRPKLDVTRWHDAVFQVLVSTLFSGFKCIDSLAPILILNVQTL